MRTILISGASSGIGLKIAHKQLKEGNRVSAGIRDLESLEGSIIDPRNWPNEQLILNKYDALDKNSSKNWKFSSREECRICRSRKMLKNATTLALGGFDTQENEPI